jgi:hypothetical protein
MCLCGVDRICNAGYMLPLICLVSYAQFLTQLAFIPVFKTLLRSLDCSQVEGFTVLKGDSPLDSPWRWDINPLLQDRETALHVDPSAGEKPVPRKKTQPRHQNAN